jgi:conserved domain protein
MSPRTGRPKADNPKTNIVRVRLDDETTERLDEYCACQDITRAEAVRKGIDLLLEQEK